MEIKLLNKDTIKTIENYNLSILDEAIRQTELKVQDESKRKERIDTRCYSLLTIFIVAVILSLNSIESNIFQGKMSHMLLTTSLIFIVAIVFLLKALKSMEYGGAGLSPEIWLQESILTGDNDMKGYMLTVILLIKQDSILASCNSNDKRLKLLNTALAIGIYAPLPIICYVFIHYLDYLVFSHF